jgi:DNA-binding NtrC family response regulator
MRILLIEDDQSIAHGLGVSLQQRGYTVEHATTLAQAWSILTLEHFDALILDLGFTRWGWYWAFAAHPAIATTYPAPAFTAHFDRNGSRSCQPAHHWIEFGRR